MSRIIAIFLLLMACVGSLKAQNIKIIKLKQEKITYQPRSFHIVSVQDDRMDTTTIGTARFGILGKKMGANLQDGVTVSLSNFLQKNLVQNTNTIPISLHISELEISEKQVGYVKQLDIAIKITFYQGDRKLIEYAGSGYQQSNIDASMYIEQLIRDRVENCLKEFDKWWKENATDGKSTVKVTTTIIKNTDDADLIPYSKERRLTLDDFQGEVDDVSKAAAATYSGIALAYNSESQNGQVNVKVTVSPYFDKSKSWCRKNAHDARTLSHEQLHFDITAIKACELIKIMQSFNFSADNYGKEIDQLRKQNEKEWQQMQNDYDKETQHGTIVDIQKQWKEKIEQQLAALTCY